ncbi:TPA: tetratricopeptide repeat protein, partial [Haemophilus influenzae]
MRFTKTLLTTALFGASIFSFQSTAWADTLEQQFQQGLTAYEQSNYQTAFKLWLPLAEQGNAKAQYNLGVMYGNGRGVKQDYFKAVNWYRKAAEQGHADAQLNLGYMYEKGRGVKQDDFEAVKWYRQAAEQGHADAQFNLGNMYAKGLGVKQD